MAHFELSLRLDAPGGDIHGEATQALRLRLYAQLGLKVFSHAWVRLRPDSGKGEALLQELLALTRRGEARVGSASLAEIPDSQDRADAPWFLLHTRQVADSFSLWDDYPACRAGSLPAVHGLNHCFVSTGFVTACAEEGWRGIDFLRCRNSGRKPGPPWYAALPAGSLGNGLDHPWFQRSRWLAETGRRPQARSSSPLTGQFAFHQRHARADLARQSPLLASLLQLCPAEAAGSPIAGLGFVTLPRYLAGSQPPGDFAYLPWGEDGPNREGKMMRFRQLALRHHVRDGLLARGLFPATAFLPLRLLERPEDGVAVLDEQAPPPPPMYTAEELARLRLLEPAA